MTTILVADDSDFVRRAVCAILREQSDFQIVGEAHDGNEAVEKVEALQPEVVVMDISMPVMNGLEAAAAIAKIYPKTKIVFLTQYPTPEHVSSAGAKTNWSYVLKSDANKHLVLAVRGDQPIASPTNETL